MRAEGRQEKDTEGSDLNEALNNPGLGCHLKDYGTSCMREKSATLNLNAVRRKIERAFQ
jgi:hypothetical protein